MFKIPRFALMGIVLLAAIAKDAGKQAKSVTYWALGIGVVALAISIFVIFRLHKLHSGGMK